ncbi:hypothetical protein DEIPH_ctg025orf0233 [Deinococcus phoenicis]|uniref:Oxidized purine nucleoside triphosphate hydrolase n=1 Tax=Deinococcus phoenicis TaxID=1476583 RepID=A0A016QR30_9DEIO|nr:8-oxo-dGTP diphosphatase [Deinococcus phoenicis]EYB68352.1 hypothetical protein DEIPH_ctg025orf0233 [Deinococcus phoenicis]
MRQATVCFLLRRHEVLLGLKKVRFGAGRYAGIGGGVEAREMPEQAALRELAEEIGVTVEEDQLQFRGEVTFLFSARPAWHQRVHIYTLTRWQGEPQESEEMRPEWFSVSALPLDRMWADAAHWLPEVLTGKTVRLECVYADDGATLSSVMAL